MYKVRCMRRHGRDDRDGEEGGAATWCFHRDMPCDPLTCLDYYCRRCNGPEEVST